MTTSCLFIRDGTGQIFRLAQPTRRSDLNVANLRLHAQAIARPRATSPEAVVTQLGALQAQDYAGALWSIALRMPSATRADVERAIAARTIVRTWPMRGTLHFVPAVDARWMLELMTPRIMKGAEGRHRRLELDDDTFRRSRTLIGKALKKTSVLSRSSLFAVLEKGGVSTAGQRGIHILQRLSMECMLCYGPHQEKQPTFVLFDEWIPTSRALARDEALQTIAERYFTSHGPATLRDFAGWTGLAMVDARKAIHLAEPSLERVDLGGVGHWLGRGEEASVDADHRAHLLPGFDEYMLGYKDRSAALEPRHSARIVPGANGMFLSTLVLDGRVIGTWRRTAKSTSVAVDCTPFAKASIADKKAFAGPVARYADYLGVPVTLGWSTAPKG